MSKFKAGDVGYYSIKHTLYTFTVDEAHDVLSYRGTLLTIPKREWPRQATHTILTIAGVDSLFKKIPTWIKRRYKL